MQNTTTRNKMRALRRVLGQTQAEFAETIGSTKDTVASWESGRNNLSAGLARRVALATGVEEESLLQAAVPLRTRSLPRRPYTREAFEQHRKAFWGGSTDTAVQRHLKRCGDTLEVLFQAAAEKAGGSVLPGVLGAFIQWCQETREDFGLEKAIDAQLAQRKGKVELRHSYRGWREMAKGDPKLARKFGFKDDPKKGDEEMLTLSLETVPLWMPGQEMRGKG
jgi:transcriptional regulator with XRE-family HTH domain